MIVKLASVLFIIAAGDFIFQRIQHTKDLMMTKQEIKEEIKQSEGDPLIKSKIRQIQRQMAQRRMMQEVPKADVIITNPTHVAVALKYDKATMAAPIVLARGYDDVAQRIKAIAAEHGIVQVENIALARALAKELDVGDAVPVKWYQAVAEILSMVYKLKKPAA
jgi:flagellar biosynthetic protein FlhB